MCPGSKKGSCICVICNLNIYFFVVRFSDKRINIYITMRARTEIMRALE